LSTLTKVMIVLLSLSSIFLSGMMVIFVASTNYSSESVDALNLEIEAFELETASYDQRFREKTVQMEQAEKVYQKRIQELQSQLDTVVVDKRSAETERDDLQIKVNTMASAMANFESTISIGSDTLKLTQTELTKAQSDQTKLRAQLNTSETDQFEMQVKIQTLNAMVKNLSEAKKIYEDQILALSNGGAVSSGEPVTRVPDFAMAATAAPTSVALKGTVTEISANLDLVAISLGSADGVTKKTIFFVTRGDQFICNLKITNVDTDKSAGVIELPKHQPKVGDTVSNRL
jgi:hypothetical protein